MTPLYPGLAGIVLAAGGSSRLGQAKQLVVYQGETLVKRAVTAALSLCGAGVTVVTGCSAEAVTAVLQQSPVNIVYNPDWKDGIASSLRAAISEVNSEVRSNDLEGVLICLCDQPLITAEDLARLSNVWHTSPHEPAAASYANILGVPAIFPPAYFSALMELDGDAGARSVLVKAPDVSVVDMPVAGFDIDTETDLEELFQSKPGS
jgi:molybdenum cofactor cytidylyltransferase